MLGNNSDEDGAEDGVEESSNVAHDKFRDSIESEAHRSEKIEREKISEVCIDFF